MGPAGDGRSCPGDDDTDYIDDTGYIFIYGSPGSIFFGSVIDPEDPCNGTDTPLTGIHS